MKKKWRALMLTVLAAIFVLVACGQQGGNAASSSGSQATSSTDTSEKTSSSSNKLKIVTTFYPMTALTQAVAGDHAEISTMIKGNTEAHDYEPSAQDIAALQEADVFVYNSEDMEGWVEDTLKTVANKNLKVIEAADEVEEMSGDVMTIDGKTATHEDLEAEEHHEDGDHHDHDDDDDIDHHADPHTWLDPVNAQMEVTEIANELAEVDPTNAKSYKDNANAFNQKLQKLADDFASATKDAKTKTFVTQHAAFNYLAHRYGLTQVAVTGVSDNMEPSAQRMAEVQDYLKKNNTTYMFVQEGTSDQLAKSLTEGTNTKISTLNSMETFSNDDELTGDGFLQKMQDNLEHLKLVLN
ncbi:MAG: zinc ABC transporter substrate-binding protein [Aerococcus sp.]|nr:zinc ABC transporter substrate-binding protein [Aerococcus sp.]